MDGGTEIIVYGPSEEKMEDAKTKVFEALGYKSSTAQYNDDDEDEVIDWEAIKGEFDAAQQAKWAKCPTLKKDFYEEHDDVKLMSKNQVSEFRQNNNNIVVSNFDENSTSPLMNPCATFYQAFHQYPEVFLINKLILARDSQIALIVSPLLRNYLL